MGVTTSNKELSTTSIKCGESFNIKLSLAAEPDIVSNPTDIVLVLDRSRSMAGSPFANLKSGAKRFIQIIDESTDGAHDGHIGNGSHIGIVSFASTATQSAYVAITPDDEELETLFEDLARNISKPGATDIVLTDTVSPCFKITSLSAPTKGTASVLDANSLRWKIDKLGVSKSEGAVLEFTVEHIGTCSGDIEVNESIDYDDAEHNDVDFPSPYITVDYGT